MNLKETNEHIVSLLNNLPFRLDYLSYLNDDSKLLIVEGQTDKVFIEHLLCEDAYCLVANKAFEKRGIIEPPKSDWKEAIFNVVKSIYNYSQLLSVPSKLEELKIFIVKNGVYGMVDLDDDDAYSMTNSNPRLFITDTHDLETLIISTDETVFGNLQRCSIDFADVNLAVNLAHQMSVLKTVLFDINMGYEITVLSSGNVDRIDYTKFVDDDEIQVDKFVNYVLNSIDAPISSEKKKKIIKQVLTNKSIKKFRTKDGHWIKLSIFDEDIWKKTNGHYILSLLKLINSDAKDAYKGDGVHINRLFEFDLIDSYDYSCFTKTDLCSRMRECGIVNDLVNCK